MIWNTTVTIQGAQDQSQRYESVNDKNMNVDYRAQDMTKDRTVNESELLRCRNHTGLKST